MTRYVSKPDNSDQPPVYVNAIQIPSADTPAEEREAFDAWLKRHNGTKAKPVSYEVEENGDVLIVRWDDSVHVAPGGWLVDYGGSNVDGVSARQFPESYVEFVPEPPKAETPDVA